MSVTVIGCVLGGDPKRLTASTVGEVKTALNVAGYTATVNGEPADDDQELVAEDFVSLSPAVKGGTI